MAKDNGAWRNVFGDGVDDEIKENRMKVAEGDFFIPDRQWIEDLRVGDLAMDCFGNEAIVERISYRDKDVNGRAFIGVYLAFGERATVSDSYKEGELHRTVKISHLYSSHELDVIEEDLLRSR